MESDQELKQTFKLFVDEHNIINLVFLEEQRDPENNTRQSELILESVTQIINKDSGKSYNMMVDLTPLDNPSYISNRSKQIYSKSPIFGKLLKIAMVTPSLILKSLATTISSTSGKSEGIRVFDNKEKALKWLK